jgi:hypothetical protein
VVAGNINLLAGTLSIAPGGSLTMAPAATFTNNGLLFMSSDAAGVSASFIDAGPGTLLGGGMFQFDRDLFCSGVVPQSTNPFGWHYISTPIPGFTTDDLPDYFVNAYDETQTINPPDYWLQYAFDPYVNPCTPWPTMPLNALEAWSINLDVTYPSPDCPALPPGTAPIVEFMGPFPTLHTGGYSLPATTSGGIYSGWNFYGNPYPSAINPGAFNWTGFVNNPPPAVNEGVAIYDGCAGNYIYSGLGNGYPFNVGPTQGFFVLTSGAATFGLTGAERTFDGAPNIFKESVTSLVTLEATGDGTSDMTYIRFMEGAEPGFDVADFPKLISTTEGLAQIYTTAGEEKLAINALQPTSMVPMGFTSVTSGEYTISAIETSEFENVVLEDLVTGEQTNLLTDSYSFTYNVNDNADRFMVHFTPLGTPELSANSIQIWANDHKIYVQAPEMDGDIVVFNMMGQEVVRTEVEPGLNVIPVNDRNSYFVVKVLNNEIAKTGKVYVK